MVEPEYALLVFRQYLHSGAFRKIARWSTNIATLGVERFRALPFPLPPLEEQTRIVAEAKRRLGTAAMQVAAVEASLERLPEMERELLAAAVAGELMPQNPDDEPAAALVARLGPPLPEPRRASTSAESETGEIPVTTKRRTARGRAEPTADLAKILREAGRPLPLPELFCIAGYDRDQPEQVELFYLALRAQLGHAIRQTDEAAENGLLEAIDAA
jgi:type I restriction enzyme S subunit